MLLQKFTYTLWITFNNTKSFIKVIVANQTLALAIHSDVHHKEACILLFLSDLSHQKEANLYVLDKIVC